MKRQSVWMLPVCLLLVCSIVGCAKESEVVEKSKVAVGESDKANERKAAKEVLDAEQQALAEITRVGGKVETSDGKLAVDLSSTQVADADLEHLEGMTDLRVLWLDNTQVSDAGLGHLKGLANLEILNLKSTQVTDAGLAHLRGIAGLRGLTLEYTQVTDAGLGHLEGMTDLRVLNLKGAQVTDAGVNNLKKALPRVQINFP